MAHDAGLCAKGAVAMLFLDFSCYFESISRLLLWKGGFYSRVLNNRLFTFLRISALEVIICLRAVRNRSMILFARLVHMI